MTVRQVEGAAAQTNLLGIVREARDEREAGRYRLADISDVLADERVRVAQAIRKQYRLAVFLQRLGVVACCRMDRHGEVTEFHRLLHHAFGGAAGVNANPGGPNPVYTITARNVVLQPGAPVFGRAGPVPPYGGFAISQDFRTPYVQNFNLNIQRQLSSATILQAGYVGSIGRKLPVLRDINQPINGVRPYATQYPTLATIDTVFSMTNSDYNSLQVQLRQSLWKGLAATFMRALNGGTCGCTSLTPSTTRAPHLIKPASLGSVRLISGMQIISSSPANSASMYGT